jgi:hypothetical protein
MDSGIVSYRERKKETKKRGKKNGNAGCGL